MTQNDLSKSYLRISTNFAFSGLLVRAALFSSIVFLIPLAYVEAAQVKSRAEAAATEARFAQREAEKAQMLAVSLEKKFQNSKQRNDSLQRQTSARGN